jgi:gliding motility-associated-like protein
VQSNGCTSTATRRVGVATIPPSSPRWAPLTCAEDREAPLRVRFTGADGIGNAQWDLGDGSTYTGPTAEHVYGQPGRYQPRVVIRYNNGRCVQETQLPAVEVKAAKFVPNIITPNGDDQNEVFEAAHSCPPQLQVFSRWGQKVYESAAYQNDWNGGTQPAGTYYYLMRFPDGRRVKGWLEIVR